jgi:hypothetical protein
VIRSISGRLTAGYFFVTNLGKKQTTASTHT